MDWKKYINGIGFSGILPEDPGFFMITAKEKNSVPVIADLKITHLPLNDGEIKSKLKEICLLPRMSTFAIGALINSIVSEMPDNQSFVNVGVWHGFTFLTGIVGNGNKHSVGIDNFSQFKGPKESFINNFLKYKSEWHTFYEMDYKEYFRNYHSGDIGFYIYDGDHATENQFQGLVEAEPFLVPGSLVLIDDINEDGPIEGTIQFAKQSRYKYELVFEQYTAHNAHPTFWNGIALLRKLN